MLLCWVVGAAADELPSYQTIPGEVPPFNTIPGEVPPDLRIPPDLPAVPPLPPPMSLPVEQAPPSPESGFAPGLPAGPVTNYGTGGMQAPPGAPLNPPYPAGGLTR